MGNIGRPSTGCGLCRKRRVKVSLPCYLSFSRCIQADVAYILTLISVTKVDLAAAIVKDSTSLVLDTGSQAMALFGRPSSAHLRTLNLKAVHHLCPQTPDRYRQTLCPKGQKHDGQPASVRNLVIAMKDIHEVGASIKIMEEFRHRDR